ncbi:putative F-box/LRR-repeat protein 23 isoform X1 [Lotus japonicus]|uniref:putative F-box/LRR-repeat protein 23 isoform X1 n=1 Tax=Lotus japonicus TaxID=34305 RepID=UPI0025880860|nr:putative F-box/LRR-repeat protein 23 isoform X1 [Lotus japonicus]
MAFSEVRPAKEEPNWLELPREVTAKILHKVGPFEIFTTASLVCHLWWKICMDPLMWRPIDLTTHPRYAQSKLEKFCIHAIERSCSQLEDISIEDIATDEVLKHIADSGSHLRRMRLMKCWTVSDKQLSEVVKKLPLLEEFEISFGDLSKDTLELMGKCCPHLQVLKFNMQEIKGYECDDEAFAIAKTMPRLRHLQLLGNRLTNEGLLAILDGCPHLESLDLRVCSNVDLSGSLRERCLKQIKDLRLPEDLSEVSIYTEGGNEVESTDEDYQIYLRDYVDIDWANERESTDEDYQIYLRDYVGQL